MNKQFKVTILLVIVTIISKIIGFIREISLSYIYGAGEIADAYIIASSIPIVIFSAIGVAISTTFIPMYYKIEKDKKLEFTNNILNTIMILMIIISIIGLIFTKPLVKIFAIEFTGYKLNLTIEFTKIMIFSVIFIGLNNVLIPWLQINENFIVPGMIGIPYNILIIITILLSKKINIYILSIGTLIAILSQFIFIIMSCVKNGFKYKIYINLKDEYLKKMIILSIPTFIGALVGQLNFIIDKSIASTFSDGMIVILNNGSKLTGVINGLFIGAITTVIYPMLSKLSNDKDKSNFTNIVIKSIDIVIILTIPIMIGAIVLAKPIIKLVFERGAFDKNAVYMTSITFSMYALGMIAFALKDILAKIFYSLKDTKIPMINGTISVVLNIILNIVLSKFIGYAGLALATSISSILCILLLFRSLGKKMGYYGRDKIVKTLSKSTISALIMGVVTYFVYKFLGIAIGLGTIKEAITLILSILVGAIVYGTLVILFKIEEVNIILYMIKSKTKIKKSKA